MIHEINHIQSNPRLSGLVGTTGNSPDNRGSENMNINEEQNRAKLIKLRKRYLIVKQKFYKSFGIQYRLHLHFYLLWKEGIACALKT